MLKWAAALAAVGTALVVDDFFAGIVVGALVRWALLQTSLGSGADDVAEVQTELPSATIAVIGNVGAGKSTAIRAFEATGMPDTTCICEPIDAWGPLLRAAEFPNTAWLELQIAILAHYARPLQSTTAVTITERDFASVAVFSGFNSGIRAMLKSCAASGTIKMPTAVLYLSTTWDECMVRMRDRKQDGDVLALSLGAKYFEALERRHRALVQWYMKHGVAVVSVSSGTAAATGLSDLHEYAVSTLDSYTPKLLNEAMIDDLLSMVWPDKAVDSIDSID